MAATKEMGQLGSITSHYRYRHQRRKALARRRPKPQRTPALENAECKQGLLEELSRCPLGPIGYRAPPPLPAAAPPAAARLAIGPLLRGSSGLLKILLGLSYYPIHVAEPCSFLDPLCYFCSCPI